MNDPAIENEANYFAMHLLVPTSMLLRECREVDLCDDTAIKKLARKFKVSETIMAFRLAEESQFLK